MLLLLNLLLYEAAAQRSSLLHPSEPSVNSEAYLNSSSSALFQLISPISSCQFHAGPIPCECFQIDGAYELQENSTSILQFNVTSPKILVEFSQKTLPLLTRLGVKIQPKLCQLNKYSVQLWQRPLEVLPNAEDPWEMQHSSQTLLKDVETLVTFPCEALSRTGIYRVHVVGPNNVTIVSTDTLFVNSSDEMRLSLKPGSIFPNCADDYSIRWSNPRCAASSLQYRLRIMAIPEGNPDQEESRAIYVEEIALDPGDAALSLPCSQFDILYAKYCFELSSLEPSSEQFHQWHVHCVHTEPVEAVHGGWSSWSSWSACEGACSRGVRTRTRKCNAPTPRRGRTCRGDVMEREICALPPCPESYIEPNSNCSCGCALSEQVGTFYASGPNCEGNATWRLAAQANSHVEFVFVREGQPDAELYLYREAPYKTLTWSSLKKYESITSRQMDADLFLVLVQPNTTRQQMHAMTLEPGFVVAYSIRRDVLPLALGHKSCYPFCAEQLIVAGGCIFLLLLIIAPPFICASLTKRVRRNSTPDLPLLSKRADNEMVRSGNTDTTSASCSKNFVAKRSIGIQLSNHGTPRIARATTDTPLPIGSSAASVLDELEYDDYDGSRDPGSILAPPVFEPYSTIDIDQIIAEARRIVDHVNKSDAHTQFN